MAEFKIDGRMTVKKLKELFFKEFEGTLRVYNGRNLANDDATLASIRSNEGAKTGELTCRANRTVGAFEKEMLDVFGIKVQVATKDDFVLVLDGITLSRVKEIPKNSTTDSMKEFLGYQRQEKNSGQEVSSLSSKSEEVSLPSTNYKYVFDFGLRAKGLQLIKITEDQKKEVLARLKANEYLDDIFMDFQERLDYEFALERQYVTYGCDRYGFAIWEVLDLEDEDIDQLTELDIYNIIRGDTDDVKIYESEDVDDFIREKDKTYDEDYDLQVEGWKFEGIEDGDYLAKAQTLKGTSYQGLFVLDEVFDENKLYIVRDKNIDEEFIGLGGDYMYSVFDNFYYKKGEGYDLLRDKLEIIPYGENPGDEQYWTTYLLNQGKLGWTDLGESLEENEEDED